MKKHYRKLKRRKIWYSVDIKTGARKSLHTENEEEADRIISAWNHAENERSLNREIAKAYLKHSDPDLSNRTWRMVLDEYSCEGGESTKERKRRAFRENGPFQTIRNLKLIDTKARHFREITRLNQRSTINYLKQVQNWALKNGYLLDSIIHPSLLETKRSNNTARGITLEEHQSILDSLRIEERRNYYQMLWLTGAAQTDGANLRVDDFDLDKGVLQYTRKKTGSICRLQIPDEMRQLLQNLPTKGFLFPKIQKEDHRARAKEFRRKRHELGISGVTLHSYRYAWAERACEAGIPERFAMAAIGHSSNAIHRAYAKNAVPVCPVIEFPVSRVRPVREEETHVA